MVSGNQVLPKNLESLSVWINEKFSDNLYPLNISDQIIKSLSSPEWLRMIINSIVTDSRQLGSLENRSFYHCLGVNKIILSSEGYDKPELRLHIWPNPTTKDSNFYEDIHNHRWDFSSAILSGEFDVRIYSESVQGIQYYKYNFVSVGNGVPNKVEYDGLGYLKEKSHERVIKGYRYHLIADQLHTIIPTDSFCSTLFLRLPYSRDRTEVYIKNKRDMFNEDNKPKKLEKQKIKSLLEKLSDEV